MNLNKFFLNTLMMLSIYNSAFSGAPSSSVIMQQEEVNDADFLIMMNLLEHAINLGLNDQLIITIQNIINSDINIVHKIISIQDIINEALIA